MSLKDRLNGAQKQIFAQVKQNEEEKYYKNNIESSSETLGVLNSLLIDDELNSIFVSGAKNIYLEKKGKIFKSSTTYKDNTQLENLIRKNAQLNGIELNDKNAVYKFAYEKGINITSTIPPLTNVPTIYIKCYQDKHANLQKMQEELIVSKEIALVLEMLCSIPVNILIIGNKNTFKTSLMSALAKSVPSNSRVSIVDSENELLINKENCTNYDFSKILDKNQKEELISSITNFYPDKLVVNTEDEELLASIINKSENKKGVIVSIEASESLKGIEKLARIIAKNTEYETLEQANAKILSNFDVVIKVEKNELGKRKISAISQINLKTDSKIIQDIFYIDYQQEHKSTGIVPIFFELNKDNFISINDTIFSQEYNHTYYNNQEPSSSFEEPKKVPNIDILKKFKKDLPTLDETKTLSINNNSNEENKEININIEDIENNLNENNNENI